jgi:phosphoglycolate phosphatase
MQARGVLFDKDGTLVDFEATWRPVYAAVSLAAAGGDAVLAQQLLEDAGQGPDGCIDPRSALACGTLDEIWEIWRHRGPLDTAALDRLAERTAVPVPTVALAPVFAALEGYRLGMATMDTTASARRTAEALKLPFDFITGCDGGHGLKPGPGMVLGFCQAVGLKPAEVVMVGDTLHDLHAARAAGAVAVAVSTGASPAELLRPHADYVLPSVAALPSLLRRLPSAKGTKFQLMS